MQHFFKSILFIKCLIISLVLSILVSCTSKLEKEIQSIPMDFELHRFDKKFATAHIEDLAELKEAYPIFFNPSIEDEFWIEKIQDTLQIELETEVLDVFPKDEDLYNPLKNVFQHIKYYFPHFDAPVVYTSTTDVAYEYKVILAGEDMVIGLDNYLGKDHYFYEGIQRYFTQNMHPARIPIDVSVEIARHFVAPIQDRTFLSEILYYGKLLYMAELWNPRASDALIIGYTDEQWQWAIENEEDIWRYFIEKEILYSTDSNLKQRFIDDGPFSKFYLEIDNESPGRIGMYIGWKIVSSYMKHNKVSFDELAILDADLIFKNSKYKPRKNK